MSSGDPIEAALDAARALVRAGVDYAVGGSVASTVHGEPRSTQDVDVVAVLDTEKAGRLADRLEQDFLVDRAALREAARTHGLANVVHARSFVKVDIYARSHSGFAAQQVDRAVAVQLTDSSPQLVRVVSPEDIVLQKLAWFREGGEVSDRQWRDVLGVLETQRGRLDSEYLEAWARKLEVEDLLRRAVEDAAPG